MIKRLSVIIALGIALSLSACGNTAKVNEPIEEEKVTEAIESTPEVTEEPETATEEATQEQEESETTNYPQITSDGKVKDYNSVVVVDDAAYELYTYLDDVATNYAKSIN